VSLHPAPAPPLVPWTYTRSQKHRVIVDVRLVDSNADRNMLPVSASLMKEELCYSETLVTSPVPKIDAVCSSDTLQVVALLDLLVSVLAIGLNVRGFKPGRRLLILMTI
jgi:hypothetical protein